MAVLKCVGLVVLLVLALGWLASGPLGNLPDGARGPLFLAVTALAVWLSVYGCRRIWRAERAKSS